MSCAMCTVRGWKGCIVGEWWVVTAIVCAAVVYCVARGLRDLRERRFGWAALGLASAVGLLCVPMPITTQAVKVDLPVR